VRRTRNVFPDTAEQRCWWHVTGNVLAALPKSAHPAAKAALAEIWGAEDKDHALAAARAFAACCRASSSELPPVAGSARPRPAAR
jgi:transposase-like protein